MSIFFLSSSNLGYLLPVYDPWFSANGTNWADLGALNISKPDYAVTTMICADQYRMCNPANDSCTPLGGIRRLRDSVLGDNTAGFNVAQLATAGRLLIALTNVNTYNVVQSLGVGALWANNIVFGSLSPGLPDNQWQIEVLGWFQTSLAKLQAYVVDFASNAGNLGPLGTADLLGYEHSGRSDPLYSSFLDQCRSQLVQTEGQVQNFNFFGVLITVCLSGILILLDMTLERLVDLLNHQKGWQMASKRARQADDKLHLLRMALAREDEGNWRLGNWSIPVRDGHECFDRALVAEELVAYTPKGGSYSRG